MARVRIPVPLVVDIDRTLVSGDLLIEAAVRLIAASPLAVLSLPFRALLWIIDGGAALRRSLSRVGPLTSATLALNPAVMHEIAAAQASGRQVWLASTADEQLVAPLAQAVGAAGCIAADGRTRLTGGTRASALVDRFGDGGFDYVGSARCDLPVWRRSRQAVGVGLSASVARAVRALDGEARLLPRVGARPFDYVRSLRPRQWIKNVLVFVPLLAAHETRLELWLAAAGLFGALSACASGAYLMNDLLDLPHDRAHERKRRRPLAAGRLPLLPVAGLGAALVLIGVAAAFGLSAAAGLCVLSYVVVTLAYSLVLKRRMFVDVVALAVLFTLRTLAGAAAAAVPVSSWFLAFAFFVFLALAILKRQGELSALRAAGRSELSGRAYTVDDRVVLASLGAACGMASVVVLALYIQSPEVRVLYGRPEVLWLTGLFLAAWLGRMMLLADRGDLDDDPVLFATQDLTTWLTAIGIGILVACAAVL